MLTNRAAAISEGLYLAEEPVGSSSSQFISLQSYLLGLV